MTSYKDGLLEKVLPFVMKPSRYVGGEWNAVRKDPAQAALKVALVFPDAYEIGMSHLGLKILYQILNRRDDILAERAFAPWVDAEALLRRHRIPLCSHESGLPLSDFDLVGFTLQYELSASTILNCLELAGIPLRWADRGEADPFVIAGGPVAFEPEPVADFFDLFLIGDAEEAILDLAEAWLAWKAGGGARRDLLEAWARIPGMYVPPVYTGGAIRKRTALKLDVVDYGAFPIPFMEIVHDRVNIEAMRGCTQGCRFCQAGYLYRPIREHSAEKLRDLATRAVKKTGYEEVSLCSLSIADLTDLKPLVPPLMADLLPERVSLSLPSLRVEALVRNPELAQEVGRVRKTGFTIAPEAGSRRLRKLINKEGFDEEEILAAVENAARGGSESVKFYFMIGLPTETPEDLEELVRVARESARIARRHNPRFHLTVSVSSFVPKPHTPFQWCAQEPMEALRERQRFLKGRLREARIDFKWHQAESSFLEAVFSVGDRRLGRVIERAHALGCRFDGWTEALRFEAWMRAFEAEGIDPHAYANRPRALEDPLPWDHIDCGVTKKFLWREWQKAQQVRGTPDCHVGPCAACGEVCMPTWPEWAAQVGMIPAEKIRLRGKDRSEPMPDPGLGADPGSDDGWRVTGAEAPEARPPVVRAEELEQRLAPKGGTEAVQRLCFEFQKVGELRFLSVMEVSRTLARALRRAELPVAYSQGFNPQPRLAVALALPVGVAGVRELGEVELRAAVGPDELVARWNAELPAGLRLLRAWEAPLSGPALTTRVTAAVYEVALPTNGWDPACLAALEAPEACAAFLTRPTIPVEAFRKGQTVQVDARPFLAALRPLSGHRWEVALRVGPTGSVRPDAVMRRFLETAGADGTGTALQVTRTGLVLDGRA